MPKIKSEKNEWNILQERIPEEWKCINYFQISIIQQHFSTIMS